jgi:hypothetical protein
MANDVAGRRTKNGCPIQGRANNNNSTGNEFWCMEGVDQFKPMCVYVNCGCGNCNHGMPIYILETFRPRGHPA